MAYLVVIVQSRNIHQLTRSFIDVTPNLLKLDCNEYVNRVAADLASRGLVTFEEVGKQVIEKAISDCEAENKRRGY